jgi:hypothetical protein
MKLKLSSLTLVLIFLLHSVFVITLRWNEEKWKNVIVSDAKGYYDLLPSAFIRHDLSKQDSSQEFSRVVNGRVLNKYYIGTPVLMLPFFGGSYLYAVATGHQTTGYSMPFQKGISLAALFYLMVGLWCIQKILQQLGMRDLFISTVLLLLVYATNLLHYSVIEPGMSHVYSFFAISCFLYTGMSFFNTQKKWWLFVCAAAFAFVLLIRPINGLVLLLLPFLAGSWANFKQLFKLKTTVLASSIVCLLIVCIQFLSWHIQTGKWMVWSYPGEGFYFLRPAVVGLLFSYKKGFFVYTPIALLALAGLIPLYRLNRLSFYSLVVTLLSIIWVLSSWWSWSYAGSFSQRPFVDFLPLFAILLAYLLNFAFRFRLFIAMGCILALALNVIQTYQYETDILDHNYMNKGKYWNSFLRTDKEYRNSMGGIQDDRPYSKTPPIWLGSKSLRFLPEDKTQNNQIITDPAGDSLGLCYFYSDNEFGPELNLLGNDQFVHCNRIYLELGLSRFENFTNSSSGALVSISVTNKNNQLEYYYCIRLNDYPALGCCEWRTYEYTLDIPPLRKADSQIKVYVWNRGKESFCIKDLRVKAWGIGK